MPATTDPSAAMILYAKFGLHQPLNRQSEAYAREGIDLPLSTLADDVGACLGKRQSKRLANASSAARDQGGFAVQPKQFENAHLRLQVGCATFEHTYSSMIALRCV